MKWMYSLLVAGAMVATTAIAQEEEAPKTWTIKGAAGLNVSQTSLTNWASGGENTVAGNVFLNVSANYKKEKWSWDNALVTDFGQTYTKSNGWQKSVDKFNLTSKVGYGISKYWSAAFLFDFLTQFRPGYANATDKANGILYSSEMFSPAYLNLSLGFDYKPVEYFSLFLSPAAGKFTYVGNDRLSAEGAFGVKPGKHLLAEFGATAVANFNKEVYKNVNLVSKLTLYSAYNNNFGNIDVLWDVMLNFRFNKYFSANITTNLVYDDDVKSYDAAGVQRGPKIQFREIIGLGVGYTF